jgi:hypothetical protein
MIISLVVLSFLGCGGDQLIDSGGIVAPEYQFTLAAIADPHIVGSSEHDQRLEAVVTWLNTEADPQNIELVVVLGDIGWGEGLERSKEMLDLLEITWLPVIGDNESHAGDEAGFDVVFGPQYEALSNNPELSGWVQASTPVWDPDLENDRYLQNTRFDYKGLRIIGLDWASRDSGRIEGEMGNLHDYEGGTWEFLEESIADVSELMDNSVILATHIPMMIGAFYTTEVERFAALFESDREKIAMNLGGHLHVNAEQFAVAGGAYDMFITNAIWDDEATVRLIDVYMGESGFVFDHRVIEIDWE